MVQRMQFRGKEGEESVGTDMRSVNMWLKLMPE